MVSSGRKGIMIETITKFSKKDAVMRWRLNLLYPVHPAKETPARRSEGPRRA